MAKGVELNEEVKREEAKPNEETKREKGWSLTKKLRGRKHGV